jgi:hypothetical protein
MLLHPAVERNADLRFNGVLIQKMLSFCGHLIFTLLGQVFTTGLMLWSKPEVQAVLRNLERFGSGKTMFALRTLMPIRCFNIDFRLLNSAFNCWRMANIAGPNKQVLGNFLTGLLETGNTGPHDEIR